VARRCGSLLLSASADDSCKASLVLHVGGGDGVAGSMPDSQDTHVLLLLLPDMKDDSVNTLPFAVQQVAGWIAELFCLGSHWAAGGNLLQAENGPK
jgi:hypothetical protein